MIMQISSTTYLTICALLRDALLVPSDATPMLEKAASELAHVPLQALPPALQQDKKKIAALQQAGFANIHCSMSQMAARPVARP
ncbi:MAG: hypothetical protein KBA75_09810 [Alphaproteobacteria bacterium]|nr:hypothetical protein [Alphaproteobacteria bacterium]